MTGIVRQWLLIPLLLLVSSGAWARIGLLPCADYQHELGLGPLSIRSQSPGQALRLTPTPRIPVILAPGQHIARLTGSATSIYVKEPGQYFLDFHMTDTRLALGWGVGACWSLEAAVTQRRVVNAYLDDITLGFHRAFGYENSGQDGVPRNDTRIDLPNYGIYLDKADRGIFSQAVEITASRLIHPAEGFRPAVALSFIGRYEMLKASEPRERRPDWGMEISIGKRLGEKDHLYANLSYLWFGNDNFIGIRLKPRQFSGMLTYEWRTDPEYSWIAQYLYSEGVILNAGALGDPSHEVHLGAKWRSRRLTWELALIENIITYNNSPDFGFSAGVSWRF